MRLHLQEVMHFLEELTKAMGKDVKFKTEMIYRAGVFAAGVTWHLGIFTHFWFLLLSLPLLLAHRQFSYS